MPQRALPGISSLKDLLALLGHPPRKVNEHGTFPAVYKDRDVQITILENHTHESSEIAEEVDAWLGLEHQNVLGLLFVLISPLGLVTEPFPHENLEDVMKTWQHKDTPPVEKLQMLVKSAEGMEYMHTRKRPVIHKNLTPSYVMVKEDCTPMINPFGYYIHRRKGAEELDPRWLACEVANGKEASTKSDVYSFGIIMWEVITGRNPWDGEDKISVWFSLRHSQHPVLDGLPKSWAGCGDLKLLVNQCLSTAPADRPSFSEIVKRLKYILGKMEYGKARGFARRRSSLLGGCGFLTKILRIFWGCFKHSTTSLELPLTSRNEEGEEHLGRSSNGFGHSEFKKDNEPSAADDLQTKTSEEDTNNKAISCTLLNHMSSLAKEWGEHCERIQDSDWQKFLSMIPRIDASCGEEIKKLKVPKKTILMDIRQLLISLNNMETTAEIKPAPEGNIDRNIGCHGIHHSIWKKLLRLVLASLDSYNDEVFKEFFETMDIMELRSSSIVDDTMVLNQLKKFTE